MDVNKLERTIREFDVNRDSDRFHSVIGDMLRLLNFKSQDEWFGVYFHPYSRLYDGLDPTPILEKDIETVRKMSEGGTSCVRSFARIKQYIRSREFVVVETRYSNFQQLEERDYVAWLIKSNSQLGSHRDVVDVEPPQFSHDPLVLTFDDGKIKKYDGHFYFHPLFIHELVKEKRS